METGYTKNQIVSILTKSPHGNLSEYSTIGLTMAMKEPEFWAHLIAWNAKKGEVRDAKAALPMIGLATSAEPVFQENALAHAADLSPREFDKALSFGRTPGMRFATPRRTHRRLVERYLRDLEVDWHRWDRTAVQHRDVLRRLYALYHIRPGTDRKNIVIFGRDFNKVRMPQPSGTAFEAIAALKKLPAIDAANAIQHFKIPFLIANGALGNRPTKETDLALAIIDRMTPNELMANTKMLDRWGITRIPELRAAYEQGLKRVVESKKPGTASLKADTAAKALASSGDDDLAAKLQAVQEKKLASISMDGDWLVLGDKSGSMDTAIESARQVAGLLAKAAKGKVYLVFFDFGPTAYDVTGKTYEEIKNLTRFVRAEGGTSIGCGLQYAKDKGWNVDAVAIVSDGGENAPPYFGQVYANYCKQIGKDIPVYLYHCGVKTDAFTRNCLTFHVDVQTFDLGNTVDYYSLPNLIQTMRTNRYSLVDEIMETPLLSLDAVLKHTKDMKVLTHAELLPA